MCGIPGGIHSERVTPYVISIKEQSDIAFQIQRVAKRGRENIARAKGE